MWLGQINRNILLQRNNISLSMTAKRTIFTKWSLKTKSSNNLITSPSQLFFWNWRGFSHVIWFSDRSIICKPLFLEAEDPAEKFNVYNGTVKFLALFVDFNVGPKTIGINSSKEMNTYNTRLINFVNYNCEWISPPKNLSIMSKCFEFV